MSAGEIILKDALSYLMLQGEYRAQLWAQKMATAFENFYGTVGMVGGTSPQINRIYDGVEAEIRKSQASFQII